MLLSSPGPEGEMTDEQWQADDPAVVALREAMAKLFQKQKRRGGIIDLEHEKNKFLVSQTSVSVDTILLQLWCSCTILLQLWCSGTILLQLWCSGTVLLQLWCGGTVLLQLRCCGTAVTTMV